MIDPQVISFESEAGFRAMFQYATIGILVINSDGYIQVANPYIEKFFGYKAAELMGQPVEILLPQAMRKRHVQHRDGYFENPKNRPMGHGLELFARKKDGSEFPVEISLGHYQLEGEELAVAFVTDISKRKKAEEEARRGLESEALTLSYLNDCGTRLARIHDLQQGLLQMLTDAIQLTAADMGNVQLVDPGKGVLVIATQKGFTQEFLDYFREVSASDTSACGRAFRERKQIVVEDTETDLSFASHREIARRCGFRAVQSTPLYGLDGAPIGMISTHFHHARTFTDQELKKMELFAKKAESFVERSIMIEELEQKVAERTYELAQSLEREKELSELKSRFMSIASHEFRTPLTTILSSTSLIDSYNGEEQAPNRKKHTDRIKSSVKNLIDILNEFLSLDKLEQGKVDVLKESLNLNTLSTEIIEELSDILKTGQTINLSYNGRENITIDKKILRNVLLNLLSNASKYSGEHKNIYLSIEAEKQLISISVKDEGIGIPEEDQKELFGTFFRARNATNIQGTGLGLNIVKRYVELLEGTITFISRLGVGTTFSVTFPA